MAYQYVTKCDSALYTSIYKAIQLTLLKRPKLSPGGRPMLVSSLFATGTVS
jgi:hypothetical protein